MVRKLDLLESAREKRAAANGSCRYFRWARHELAIAKVIFRQQPLGRSDHAAGRKPNAVGANNSRDGEPVVRKNSVRARQRRLSSLFDQAILVM